MLCDEGHRLKNMESATYVALNGLKAQRRVILSGTPIQNDLTEYFSLLNFTNPSLLGTPQEFRKNFELPILRGRDAMASEKDRDASEAKLRELLEIASKFMIRRTAELLTKYLPIKYEHVVFCRLTPAQLRLYKHYATSKAVKKLLDGSNTGTQPLKAITVLKKICNHPALLEEKDLQDLAEVLPEGFDPKGVQTELSGKMVLMVFDGLPPSATQLLLDRMLTMIRKTTDDKIVLISNYTQTLDLFERLCRLRRWSCLRLDGSMTVTKRGKLVEKLNDAENKQDFVFLLSSKAGGCGLNLIGANRLVLFDPG
ncbi:DNA-dependent ATPase protein rad54, partial [Gonapodya sp. JEL0774]